MTTLSAIVVTYRSRAAIGPTLAALAAQLGEGDQIVVVDNASDDGTADAVADAAPDALLIRNDSNAGFAAAANLGADHASGELLVFLNPDAVAQPGFADAIRAPLLDRRGWAAWMGVVLADGGRTVNSAGGVVHFTGIAWAGGAGMAVEDLADEPREVAFVSGACFAVPGALWREAGGFAPEFFMYCEDVDLSLRLRLAGGRLGVEPRARVDHAYDFHKGALKWRLLERNRWATIVRTYPGTLLALLAPALLATEAAIALTAVRSGWGRAKAAAVADVLRALPRLRRERRAIQAERRIGTRRFAACLTADLSSPYLAGIGRSVVLQRLLRAYWNLAVALLRLAGPR